MVGLPGRMDTPWASNSLPSMAANTRRVKSRWPTELPPESSSRSQSASAVVQVACMRAKSSVQMPRATGTPPASSTRAASEAELMSRILPGGGVWSAGTSSSPVERMATRGRRCTETVVRPRPASTPRSWGRSRWPAARIRSPGRQSSPARMTFSPGATGRNTATVVGSSRRVYSTMTTASALSGNSPPVQMRAAWPGPRARVWPGSPMAISPTTVSRATSDSEQPKVLAARTA